MVYTKRTWEPKIEGDLAYIPLSQGKWAVIDKIDLPLVRDYSWSARVGRYTFYAQTSVRQTGRWTVLLMHRRVLGLQPGDPGPDHINHDGLDNRRLNLRPATNQQNSQNQRPRPDCSSRFKGVSWNRNNAKWQAKIYYDGKQHHLGYYADEKKAALAYDQAARIHFDAEFAYLNLDGT